MKENERRFCHMQHRSCLHRITVRSAWSEARAWWRGSSALAAPYTPAPAAPVAPMRDLARDAMSSSTSHVTDARARDARSSASFGTCSVGSTHSRRALFRASRAARQTWIARRRSSPIDESPSRIDSRSATYGILATPAFVGSEKNACNISHGCAQERQLSQNMLTELRTHEN